MGASSHRWLNRHSHDEQKRSVTAYLKTIRQGQMQIPEDQSPAALIRGM
jgi:hypothetical protein